VSHFYHFLFFGERFSNGTTENENEDRSEASIISFEVFPSRIPLLSTGTIFSFLTRDRMSDLKSNNSSSITDGVLQESNRTSIKNEAGSMQAMLRWGLVLMGVAVVLFIFICLYITLVQRRRRRHIAPQGRMADGWSTEDTPTVIDDEESLDPTEGKHEG